MPEKGSLDAKLLLNTLKCHKENAKADDKLNSILNSVRDAVITASSGFMHPERGNLTELNRKVDYLILAFRSTDPTIFTINEHNFLSNLEDRSQPGYHEVYESGENLYVSISSRIISRYYPLLLRDPSVFNTAFLEDFIPLLDDFLTETKIITTLKLKAYAAGFLNAVKSAETGEFNELREIVLLVNRFCTLAMLHPDDINPPYIKDLNSLFVTLKKILASSRLKKSENN